MNAIERIKGVTDASMLRIVIPALLSLLSVMVTALGWSVNKVADHLDRIDTYMSANTSDTRLLRRDVDEEKGLVAQNAQRIQEIHDQGQRNAWDIQELRAARRK